MELIYKYDPYRPVSYSSPADAQAALEELAAGNRRFAEYVQLMHRVTLGEKVESPIVIEVSPMSLGLPLWADGTLDQTPFALVVGCADARAPVETILDQSINSLFVVRIAGNALGSESLASVDYAARHLRKNLRLVLVLGHSGCGAVTAAVDTYLKPDSFSDIAVTHALRMLIDRLSISVRGAARALQTRAGAAVVDHPKYRTALIELAVYMNAAVTAYDLQRELREIENNTLPVVFGVYDLDTLRIHAAPEAGGVGTVPQHPPFAPAPAHAEDFGQLARDLAEHVATLYGLA